jgi:hypothetical protein
MVIVALGAKLQNQYDGEPGFVYNFYFHLSIFAVKIEIKK